MPADDARLPRQRVTHPRTDGVRVAGRQHPARGLDYAREIDEQTRLGEMYVTSLVRTQRRIALASCVSAAFVLLVFAVVAPSLARDRVFGLPVPWVALGVLAYPLLIGLAWLTMRSAERVERDFADVVRQR